MDLREILIFYNLTITMIAFGIATFKDIKKREVEDRLWIILAILTLPSSFYMLGLMKLIINFLPCFLFGILLYYVFKFGGADAKAIWTLSIAIPYSPFETILPVMPVFPISIVFNSVIISAFYIFVNVFHNVNKYIKEKKLFNKKTPISRKVMLFIFSQKLSEEEYYKSKFYVPALKNGKLNLGSDIREFDFEKKEYVCEWYEKAQPFLVYIAISIPFTIVFGDLSLGFVSFLLKQ
ncbi:MAG TPA: A24 family peptidase [Geobacterales bacterium]|nr:A24 family peptidase [Geobacterales bacterium]